MADKSPADFVYVPPSEVGKARCDFASDIGAGVLVGLQFRKGDLQCHWALLPDSLEKPEIMAEIGRRVAKAFRKAEGG